MLPYVYSEFVREPGVLKSLMLVLQDLFCMYTIRKHVVYLWYYCDYMEIILTVFVLNRETYWWC